MKKILHHFYYNIFISPIIYFSIIFIKNMSFFQNHSPADYSAAIRTDRPAAIHTDRPSTLKHKNTPTAETVGVELSIKQILQLWTCSNKCLTSFICLILLEVLDESLSKILSLSFPLRSISVCISRIKDLC